jgi:hypothetical protein
LVRDGGHNPPILLQLLVDFDAFVTHDSHPHLRESGCPLVKTVERRFCSSSFSN